MDLIHFNTAMAITGLSKRTLWRRISSGVIDPCDKDSEGRTLLGLEAVMALASPPLGPQEVALVKRADAGEAMAQADLGLMLLEAGQYDRAVPWLEMAAALGYPDAMSWLGRCYIAGQGVPCDEHRGLMWLSKAAAHGHVLARQQMQGLTGSVSSSG